MPNSADHPDKIPHEEETLREDLLLIAQGELAKVADFDPYKKFSGVSTIEEFRAMVHADPAFRFFGLDDKRYAVARVGGNLVTSLHRKIGDLYESLFQHLLRSRFGLSEEDLKYAVQFQINGRSQRRTTDGFVPSEAVADRTIAGLEEDWSLSTGIGFEVRSCYQIGDSKRIQADEGMALALREQGVAPVMLIFCETSLTSPVKRLSKNWTLCQGRETFQFVQELTDFDLAGFLETNAADFRKLVQRALAKI